MIDLKGPQYEPLTPEEVATLWPIAKAGNEKARERLICSTLRSVVIECYKYVTAYDVDELVSMGLYMATEAFETYDPAKGVQFYSYVVLRVRWAIGDMLREAKNTVHTDNISILEAFGGFEEMPDTDEERQREDRKETIRNYFLSLEGMTPEKLDEIIKHVEERGCAPQGLKKALKGTKPTAEILKIIDEVIGADTAANAVAAYEAKERRKKEDEPCKERKREYMREYMRRKREEDCTAVQRKAEREAEREAQGITPEQRKERQREYMREYYRRPEVKERQKERMREYYRRPEVKERQREYDREYYKRKKEAAHPALAEPHINDRIEDLKRQIEELKRENEELKRQMEEADKAVVLQRFIDPYQERRRKAVANFNTLYGFIITYTDATPMQAEAAAYMTLQGFGTLRDWSNRHGLVYESVKRWRMQVKKKLAALNDVDEDIITLDRSLFKS